MTADESAAVALAFAALRTQAAARPVASRRASGWASQARTDLVAFGASEARSNGFSTWTGTARLEALRSDA